MSWVRCYDRRIVLLGSSSFVERFYLCLGCSRIRMRIAGRRLKLDRFTGCQLYRASSSVAILKLCLAVGVFFGRGFVRGLKEDDQSWIDGIVVNCI